MAAETHKKVNGTLLLLVAILEHEHGLHLFLSHLSSEFSLESALAIIEFTQYQQMMATRARSIQKPRAITPGLSAMSASTPNLTKLIMNTVPSASSLNMNNSNSTPSPRSMARLVDQTTSNNVQRVMRSQSELQSVSEIVEDDMDSVYILKLPDIVPQSVIVYDPTRSDGVFEVKKIARKLMEKYVENNSPFEINIPYKLKKRLLRDCARIDVLDEERLRHLFDEPIQKLLMLIQQSLLRFVQTHKYREIEKELARDIEDMGFVPQDGDSSLRPQSSNNGDSSLRPMVPFSPDTFELQAVSTREPVVADLILEEEIGINAPLTPNDESVTQQNVSRQVSQSVSESESISGSMLFPDFE